MSLNDYYKSVSRFFEKICSIIPNNLEDIVYESIMNAWFYGYNFIEYCTTIREYKVDICVLYHIIWAREYNEFFARETKYSLILSKDTVLEEKVLRLIANTITIVAYGDKVKLYFNDLNKLVHNIGLHDKKVECSNASYTLYEYPDILDREE